MSQFNELLAQLNAESVAAETLVKALPVEDGKDDEAIQAAATEGDNADTNPEDDDAEEGDEKGGDDDKPMAKSVTAVVDGEEVEAIDATELLKSLVERVGTQESVLAKALESTLGTIKAQGEMIKSLSAQVKKLGGEGKGRKTVLSVVEKPAAGEQALAKSEQSPMTVQDFMAKATANWEAKKLTGREFTTLDVARREGKLAEIDQSLIAKALS
jgi:translation initiation factor 1 (eIF-1/SUI1)